MRTTGKALVAAAAGLIALTGCTATNGDGGSAGASGSPSGSTGASASPSSSTGSSSGNGATTGKAAQCLVGSWKTTKLAGTLSGNGANGSLTGGSGVLMTIGADGKTTVNFDGMQPIGFAFSLAGANAQGTFTYGGAVNGTIATTGDTSGTLEPVGNADFGSLTVSANLTSPTAAQLANKVPVAQFVGSNSASTGNAVDAQPILKRSTYTCTAGTLELGPPAGTGGVGTWTWQKA
jgi:hypothetical protein